MAGLLVKQISPFCSLQDLGRFGYRHFGVTQSGAVDPYLLRVANLLVGNQQGHACLEFTALGGEFEVTARSMRIAFVGDFPIYINGKQRSSYQSHYLSQGDRFKIEPSTGGIRGYLSVAGGFAVEPELGSCSQHRRSQLGGFVNELKSGVELPINVPFVFQGHEYFMNDSLRRRSCKRIRVVEGPQIDYFSKQGLVDFYTKPFTISNDSDRMGYRLEGVNIELVGKNDMISEPTLYGSVQVPPSGQPVVLMADCGTSGGYPKIATLASVDCGVLAQKGPGEAIFFEAISIEESQHLLIEQEKYLNSLNLRLARI